MQKEIIGNCTLYLGDSLDIASELGEFADLICTDPPYKLTSGGNNANWKLSNGTEYANDGKIVPCDITWQQIHQICFNSLKEGNHAYVMSNNRNLEEALRTARDVGFKLHNIIISDKGTVTPNRFYMNKVEFAPMYYKKSTKFINNMSLPNIFNIPNIKGNGHPTEKPVELMRLFVEQSSNENDIVFDPFMVIGTTGFACQKSNRKFIGIEIEQKYFDIACKRIEEASRQKDLFI